jgi:hypothetical protein
MSTQCSNQLSYPPVRQDYNHTPIKRQGILDASHGSKKIEDMQNFILFLVDRIYKSGISSKKAPM